MAEDTEKENADVSSNESPSVEKQEAPADALSKTPDELEEDRKARATEDADLAGLDIDLPEAKLSPFKRLMRKINVYLLIFVVLLVVAGAIALVSFLNSQKTPDAATVDSQTLTTEALQNLANTDTSVGSTAQTLTIQGSAVINGQTLARGDLNVAGNLQTGGSVTTPTLTVSGETNLGNTQVNGLQVGGDVAIQGTTTLRNLNVSGTSSFSGAVTASQITVTRLILSGNASLEVPNHISFTGSTPSRTTNGSVLGSGGSANISGSDTAGTINVNSGNNPTPGCFITVKFNQAYTRQPHVTVTPIGSAAGQLQFYVNRSTSEFSVCTANTPANNQSFGFDYFITY